MFLFKSYIIRENPIIRKIIINKYKSPLDYYKTKTNYFNKEPDAINKKQDGGASNILVKYNNESFTFNEFEQGVWSLIDKYNNDCVIIGIDSEDNEAHISNINADTTKCGITILTHQGSHLFKISLQFLKENKNKFNINKITLTDTSMISCSTNIKLNLKLFLTLLTGNTWYGKYGFRPVNSDYKRQYKHNKHILDKTKISDINFNLLLDDLLVYKNKHKITEDQYNYFIQVYKKMLPRDPLVKDLLLVIFRNEKYKQLCVVFNLIYNKIIQILNLQREYLDSNISYQLNL